MSSEESGVKLILSGIFFPILLFLQYLSDPSRTYLVPVIIGLFPGLIHGICLNKGYFNKNLYKYLGGVVLALILIVSYMLFPQSENTNIFLLSTGMGILLVFMIMYLGPKDWEKLQKRQENRLKSQILN